MRRLTALLLSAAMACGPLQAAAQTAPPPGPSASSSQARGQRVESVVALVNDDVISQSAVLNRMRLMLLSFPGQPEEEVLRQVQQTAVEDLIREKLQVQEFHKMLKTAKIEKEEIDAEIEDAAKRNNMTPQQFISGLAQEGINVQTLRDQFEAQIAWRSLVGARYARQVRVSEQRVDQQLARLKEAANKEQFRVAEIFLYAPDPGSRSNALTRAVTLKSQIEQGAEFGQVAQQFSAAPSASTGGELGWMSPADMKPEIQSQVTKSSPPAILDPIETESGVYLVAVLGKREPLDANDATLDMRQVAAKGAGAAEKIAQVKATAKSCDDLAEAVAKVEGAQIVPMNGVQLSQVNEIFRVELMPLQAGQSTSVLDSPEGKMALYVCKREQGGGLPSRNRIKDTLFQQEIEMLAERYLRDVKREATIMLR